MVDLNAVESIAAESANTHHTSTKSLSKEAKRETQRSHQNKIKK